MKHIVFLMSTALVLIGCGSNSNSGSSSPARSKNIKMQISNPYVVYPGDQIVKDSEIALLQITHVDKQDTSMVELLEGSATLIPQ